MMIVGKYDDAPFVRNTSEGMDVLLQRHTDARQCPGSFYSEYTTNIAVGGGEAYT